MHDGVAPNPRRGSFCKPHSRRDLLKPRVGADVIESWVEGRPALWLGFGSQLEPGKPVLLVPEGKIHQRQAGLVRVIRPLLDRSRDRLQRLLAPSLERVDAGDNRRKSGSCQDLRPLGGGQGVGQLTLHFGTGSEDRIAGRPLGIELDGAPGVPLGGVVLPRRDHIDARFELGWLPKPDPTSPHAPHI